MESKENTKVEGLNDNDEAKYKRVGCSGVSIARPQL
jgi:hypothetical protein